MMRRVIFCRFHIQSLQSLTFHFHLDIPHPHLQLNHNHIPTHVHQPPTTNIFTGICIRICMAMPILVFHPGFPIHHLSSKIQDSSFLIWQLLTITPLSTTTYTYTPVISSPKTFLSFSLPLNLISSNPSQIPTYYLSIVYCLHSHMHYLCDLSLSLFISHLPAYQAQKFLFFEFPVYNTSIPFVLWHCQKVDVGVSLYIRKVGTRHINTYIEAVGSFGTVVSRQLLVYEETVKGWMLNWERNECLEVK